MTPIVAIDYDDTYSKYPDIFERLRSMFQKIGTKVYIVTARNQTRSPIVDHDLSMFDKVIYTDGKAKASIVDADIYIDDNPVTLCCDINFAANQPFAVPASDLYQNYANQVHKWHWSATFGGFIPERI